jgi:hypothetical protein
MAEVRHDEGKAMSSTAPSRATSLRLPMTPVAAGAFCHGRLENQTMPLRVAKIRGILFEV